MYDIFDLLFGSDHCGYDDNLYMHDSMINNDNFIHQDFLHQDFIHNDYINNNYFSHQDFNTYNTEINNYNTFDVWDF